MAKIKNFNIDYTLSLADRPRIFPNAGSRHYFRHFYQQKRRHILGTRFHHVLTLLPASPSIFAAAATTNFPLLITFFLLTFTGECVLRERKEQRKRNLKLHSVGGDSAGSTNLV